MNIRIAYGGPEEGPIGEQETMILLGKFVDFIQAYAMEKTDEIIQGGHASKTMVKKMADVDIKNELLKRSENLLDTSRYVKQSIPGSAGRMH